MKPIQKQYMTSQILDDHLGVWIAAFITAKRAAGMTKNTILFYTRKLRQFENYCDAQQLTRIEQLTPSFIRGYLLYLEDTGHNPGGRHAAYRAVRVFLYWYESETEPEGWRNPITKVDAPKLDLQPLQGVTLGDVLALVKVCKRGTFAGDRDAALLLCLLDTACRAREFLAVNVEDVNQATGEILIRQSKGRRPRFVYLGRRSRQALRRYLKHRTDNQAALWVSREGERLAYNSLRGVVARHARQARLPAPALHGFRRGFALMFLKNGGDIFTLARILGHKDINVLRRYLAQTDADIQSAHEKYSPVDRL